MCSVALCALFLLTSNLGRIARGQQNPEITKTPSGASARFAEDIQPLLKKYCLRCHSADEMESGIRVDQLSATPEDRQIFLLNDIRKQLLEGAMPPPEEPQPNAEQRRLLTEWITATVAAARSRNTQKNGSVRRLTVSQYRNTLKELLGLEEDLADVLPPDGVSKDGFANNGHTMVLSPLQVESYFDIAEKALDLCIVDETAKPVIQNFRMDFGAAINPQPCPDNLVLGANNALLNNPDFVVTEMQPQKAFAYTPFEMRKKYEFIEGYVGNDTIRAWKKFDSIYHSVFACVRGTPGYPKGEAHQVIQNGLALRPAIPSPEIFGQSNTYGPFANFKISLRELPDEGNFRITVKAARYDDGLLLDAGTPANDPTGSATVTDFTAASTGVVSIKEEGIYQVDVSCAHGKPQGLLSLNLGERQFAGQLLEAQPAKEIPGEASTAFLVVRLPAGELKLSAKYGDNSRLRRLVFSKLPADSELARRFMIFEKRAPALGVYLGLRRDCGSTLTPVGTPRAVSGGEVQAYVFEGAIKDFPSPDVEKDNVNYLAGIREIGVRSEYTDGRDMPRLLISSIEFEGPYYTSWPPATHKNIFIESPHKHVGWALLPVSPDAQPTAKSGHPTSSENAYAREIIRSFATRAFRRPVTKTEEEAIFTVWQQSFTESKSATRDGEATTNPGSQIREDSDRNSDRPNSHEFGYKQVHFRQSIKDALLVILTSPQFLFLIENSSSPEPEDLDSYELAAKLSYFLWNAPPDQRLLELASKNALPQSLDAEIERMIHDPRFGQFVNEFAAQWLGLDKFDVVATDAQRYPKLTRDTKTQLRQEPIQFLRHLIVENLPLRNIVQSDFIVANEVVASYYNLADRTESGFQFVAIQHKNENLGGVLSQAGILAGLSDGRESNPIKRGAWLARKIVAEPPDDPPPNVPKLPEDDGAKLTLREKLERHRNQKGCVKCHTGIDPWGIPFESFDAGGLLKTAPGMDPHSTLPDGTEIKDFIGLKTYLANSRIDQVAFSFLKHTATYAVGRSLTYNEIVFLQEQGLKLKPHDYRMQEIIKFVIKSDLFMKK